MLITESKLRELSYGTGVLEKAVTQTRYFSEINRKLSVFLSHKHSDIEYLGRVRYILEQLNSSVYVDWADSEMQHPTDRSTAEKLKNKIIKYDKFIFIATDDAINSTWCNWEIGFGDAQKYDKDKIAIFPIKKDNGLWKGNEYLQLYPSIEYFDGTSQYKNGEFIPKGFYVKYKYKDNVIVPLLKWLQR